MWIKWYEMCSVSTHLHCTVLFEDLQYPHMDSAPAGQEPWTSGQTLWRVKFPDTGRQDTFCRWSHSHSIFACCHQGVPEVRRIEGVGLCCIRIKKKSSASTTCSYSQNLTSSEKIPNPNSWLDDKGTSTVLFSLQNFSRVVMLCLPADKMLFYRMYPVVSMNGRVFLDRDVTIGGYKFPKNVGLPFPG